MAKDRNLYITALHVIESLPSEELHTGRRLFEDLTPIVSAYAPQVKPYLWEVGTKEGFLDRLNIIAADAESNGQLPLLHIESHGSPEGIQLGSGYVSAWSELKPILTTINRNCRLNLFVVLSACDGFNLIELLQPTERAAFLGLVAPHRVATAGDLLRGNLAFYRVLFETRSIPEAHAAMNSAVTPPPLSSALTAELALQMVAYEYFKRASTDQALASSQANVARELARLGLSPDQIRNTDDLVKSYLRDQRSRFEEIKRRFLFCDLFPENQSRFNLSYEDCLKDPWEKIG